MVEKWIFSEYQYGNQLFISTLVIVRFICSFFPFCKIISQRRVMPTPFFLSPMIEKHQQCWWCIGALKKCTRNRRTSEKRLFFPKKIHSSLFRLVFPSFIPQSWIFPPIRFDFDIDFQLSQFRVSVIFKFSSFSLCLFNSMSLSIRELLSAMTEERKKSKADEGKSSNTVDQASTKSLETSSQMMTSFSSSKWTVSGQSYSRSVSSRRARVSLRFRTVQPVTTTLSSMSHANWTTTSNIP